MITARLADTLDTLPLHEVSPDIEELLRDYFEARWREGKQSDLWTDEDVQGLVGLLAAYLDEG